VAGGAAASCGDLEEVERVTRQARDWTRSMGVALAAGSHPETGELTFELPDDEIELGMGLHGERGVWRAKLPPADELVTAMLERLIADLPYQRGDRVCVLINDLGATTQMELLIVSRKAHQILRANGIAVHDTLVGSFCTCQEMTGFSISLMKLDETLQRYYDLPASGLGFAKA
jgi:dihydroxyacetone kinase-like protein